MLRGLSMIEKDLKKKNMQTICLMILTQVQFIVIMIVNFTKSYGLLNRDSALVIRHAWEMWNHGLFLKSFNYFSTLEIDSVGFFAIPLYMLTNNLSIALGTIHIIVYGIIFCVLNDIFENMQCPKSSFYLAVLLIFTPYTTGHLSWSDMFFTVVGQYEFRIITLLLLIDILILLDEERLKKRKAKFVICIVAYTVIGFWTALSTGNYVLLMIVCPFVLKCLLDEKKRIGKLRQFGLKYFGLLLPCLAGWLLHDYMIGPTFRNNLSIVSAENFWNNIQNCITGVFLLFGGLTRKNQESIFTLEGICILLKFFFISICLFLALRKNISKGLYKFEKYFYTYAFFSIAVLMLTNTQYGSDIFEERYHILWCIMLLMYIAIIINQDILNNQLKKCLYLGVILTISIINIFGFTQLLSVDNDRKYETTIISVSDQVGAGAIYLYNNEKVARIIRAMEPNIYCVSVKMDNGRQNMDLGNIYKYYGDKSNASDTNILVCTERELEELPEYMKYRYRKFLSLNSQQNIYLSEENFWDGVTGLPLLGTNKSIDFPFGKDYKFNGIVNENGELVLGNTEKDDCVFYRMEKDVLGGIYHIQVFYDIITEKCPVTKFEVSLKDKKQVLSTGTFEEGKNCLVLDNIYIPPGETIELRIWKSKDVVIKIRTLFYTKK